MPGGLHQAAKTSSGATAVQIVHSFHKGSREIEHIGSARTEVDLELLKAIARQRLHVNQDAFDFGDGQPARGELPILSTQSAYLWEALERGYRTLRFDRVCGQGETPGATDHGRAAHRCARIPTPSAAAASPSTTATPSATATPTATATPSA